MASNTTPTGRNQGGLVPDPARNIPATVALLAERFWLSEEELEGWGVKDRADNKGVDIVYRDMNGAELFARKRVAVKATNRTYQPEGVAPAPYGLNRLHLAHAAGYLVIAEGESDCWCGWHHGLPFLGIPGVDTFACLKLPHLVNVPDVYIVHEPDEAGGRFIANLPAHLRKIGFKGRIWELVMSAELKDPAEMFRHAKAGFPSLLASLRERARELAPLPPDPSPQTKNGSAEGVYTPRAKDGPPAKTGSGKGGSTPPPKDETPAKPEHFPSSALLVNLVLADGVELFHDEAGVPYAWRTSGGPAEVWRIGSKPFTNYLRDLWRAAHSAPNPAGPSTIAMANAHPCVPPGGLSARPLSKAICDEATLELEAMAGNAQPARTVHLRRVFHDGVTYRDLVDPTYRAVAIRPGGWAIVDRPPVPFRRPAGMLPYPDPDRAGSLDELRCFIHLADEEHWMLLVGWLALSARGVPPYAILSLSGQAGSGKTLAAWFIKDLLDPGWSGLRAEPMKREEVFVAAGLCEVLAYDNFSKLDRRLSDALCVVATGGSSTPRKHYANDEEAILLARNPVIMTGIGDVANRGDFLSRSVLLELHPFAPGKRTEEEELKREWSISRPRVLGGLFNALALALPELPNVAYDRDCRMPHLAKMGEAVGRVLGWPTGAFTRAYAANRRLASETALEGQPVARAIETFMDNRHGEPWRGSASELLAELVKVAGQGDVGGPGWPKLGNGLSNKLQDLAPDLLTRGIVVSRGRSGDHAWGRQITLSRQPNPAGPGLSTSG